MNYQEEIQKLEEQIIYLKLKKKLLELDQKKDRWYPYNGPTGMYQETNLEKAKRLYPKGSKIISPYSESEFTITGVFIQEKNGNIYVETPPGGTVFVLHDGKWAEIIHETKEEPLKVCGHPVIEQGPDYIKIGCMEVRDQLLREILQFNKDNPKYPIFCIQLEGMDIGVSHWEEVMKLRKIK